MDKIIVLLMSSFIGHISAPSVSRSGTRDEVIIMQPTRSQQQNESLLVARNEDEITLINDDVINNVLNSTGSSMIRMISRGINVGTANAAAYLRMNGSLPIHENISSGCLRVMELFSMLDICHSCDVLSYTCSYIEDNNDDDDHVNGDNNNANSDFNIYLLQSFGHIF